MYVEVCQDGYQYHHHVGRAGGGGNNTHVDRAVGLVTSTNQVVVAEEKEKKNRYK